MAPQFKRCSFCNRPQNEVRNLIIGSDNVTYICDGCVRNSALALEEIAASDGTKTTKVALLKPSQIKASLDELVISQEDAKREVAIAVYEHYRRREVAGKGLMLDGEAVEVEKSNIMMLGPSGTGKTQIFRAIAKLLNVPFYVGDATSLTSSGYVGNDVESLLQGLLADAHGDVEKAQWGIIFLDEFDKLARKSGRSASGYRDITGEGVQQALLKLIEGSKVMVPRGMGARAVAAGPNADMIDTSNILFVGAGSFAGIEEVVERRLNKMSRMGFGGMHRLNPDKTAIYKQVTVEDIEAFGMIPEIVGRMPVLTSTYELTEEDLVRILVEPKSSLTKQFRALYALDGIELQFDQDALVAIAQEAKKRSTGARALRAIMKAVLKPHSYAAPDNSEITQIRITAEAVRLV